MVRYIIKIEVWNEIKHLFIGDEARELLFNIWSSSDLDNDGKLNKNEFIISLKCDCVQVK